MPHVSAAMIKELRERTGVGMMDCKNALVENDGDMEKAIDFLRKKGLATAAKKAGRSAEQGIVEAYIHHNSKIGVLVELRCETDFVARTDEFKTLAKEIAMHVAWANPQYISKEEVPEDEVAREMEIERERALEEGKSEAVADKIVQGRLSKFYERICLLEQPFIRDDSKTVQEIISNLISVLGENIVVAKMARLAVGE